MKRIIASAIFIGILSLTSPVLAANYSDTTSVVMVETLADRANYLNNRLQQIEDMDKSNLTASERRKLRLEVKEIDKEMHDGTGGGVYLTVGGAIIIILLLIILL